MQTQMDFSQAITGQDLTTFDKTDLVGVIKDHEDLYNEVTTDFSQAIQGLGEYVQKAGELEDQLDTKNHWIKHLERLLRNANNQNRQALELAEVLIEMIDDVIEEPDYIHNFYWKDRVDIMKERLKVLIEGA